MKAIKCFRKKLLLIKHCRHDKEPPASAPEKVAMAVHPLRHRVSFTDSAISSALLIVL